MKRYTVTLLVGLMAVGLLLGCTKTSTSPQNQTELTMNVGVYPPDGSVNVTPSETLVLSFEVPVVESEIQNQLVVQRVDNGSNATVTGTYYWNDAKTQVAFVPSSPLSGTYRMRMNGSMHGRDGRNYAPVTVPGARRCDSTMMGTMHGGMFAGCDSCMSRGGMMGGRMRCDSSSMHNGARCDSTSMMGRCGMHGTTRCDSMVTNRHNMMPCDSGMMGGMGSGHMPCDSSMMGGGHHMSGGMGGMNGGMGNMNMNESFFSTGSSIMH